MSTADMDSLYILGDPEVTANIYCKSRNLPNTDTQTQVQICDNFWSPSIKKNILARTVNTFTLTIYFYEIKKDCKGAIMVNSLSFIAIYI